MNWNNWKTWLLAHEPFVFGTLALVVLQLPNFFEPYWHPTEMLSLLIARHATSALPLQLASQELLGLLYFLVLKFSHYIVSLKVVGLFAHIIAYYYYIQLIESYLRQRRYRFLGYIAFIFLTTMPTFEGNIVSGALLGTPFFIAAVWYYSQLISRRRVAGSSARQQRLLTGSLLGLSLITSCYYFIPTLGLVCHWFFVQSKTKHASQQKPDQASLELWLIPILSLGISYLFSGYYQGVAAITARMQAAMTGLYQPANLVNTSQLLQFMQQSTVRWFIFFLLLSASLIGFRKYTTKTKVLLYWQLATLANLVINHTSPVSYLLTALPLLLLLIMFFDRKAKRRRDFAIVSLGLLTIFTILSWHTNARSQSSFGYFQNFLLYLSGSKNSQEYYAWFSPATSDVYQLAEWIDQRAVENNQLLIWEDEPELYLLLQSPPPLITRSSTPQELKHYLSQAKPYVVVNQNSQYLSPILYALIPNYYPVHQVGEYTVYHTLGSN